MVDFTVSPAQTALVNVDLQNYFVDTTEDGRALVHRINQLAVACREAGILVIHTAHVLRPDGSNIGILGEIIPGIGEVLGRGAETAALFAELDVDPRDVVLEKPRFGAFYGTDLELILRSRGIETIIIFRDRDGCLLRYDRTRGERPRLPRSLLERRHRHERFRP